MSFSTPLPPEALLRRFSLDPLEFRTTAEIEDLREPVGQERALEALRFGLGMQHPGYNVYCMGPAGSGKRTLVQQLLRQRAAAEPAPPDWCYVHDFGDGRRPRALRLPGGRGRALAANMDRLVQDLRSVMPAALAGEGFETRLAAALEDLLAPMRAAYGDVPPVLAFLEQVRADVSLHAREFLRPLEDGCAVGDPLLRYRVNVLVGRDADTGAPVVYEDSPSLSNLVGRTEYRPLAGGMVTDFTLIRAGALHRANGGYLVLDAQRLVSDSETWDALKRALYAGRIRIAPGANGGGEPRPQSLEPEPVDLDVKVVLVGERALYYQLFDGDPEFESLFKVGADFEDELMADDLRIAGYVRMIATLARRDGLLALDRGAVARVLEQAARLAEDSERLDTHLTSLADLLREADYWARQRNAHAEAIGRDDVQQAIDMQIHRAARVQERIYEEITRGSLLIDTEGSRLGQVNGVSIIEMGGYAFGQPNRISATARLGEGEIVDIERETELGGSFHSKGVFILAAYLAHRYCGEKPFSLAASVVFEQSYALIDGDSASVAELCALLSALAKAPVRQYLAVTGSVNQYGEVQAIGGVNEKIEAFFDLCAARGLRGDQGVLIPAANVMNLMLREDVVQAVADGRFAVYAVDHVDQAAELLTGLPAGAADDEGVFPEGSLNRRIADRLTALAEIRHEFNKAGDGGGDDENDDNGDDDGDGD